MIEFLQLRTESNKLVNNTLINNTSNSFLKKIKLSKSSNMLIKQTCLDKPRKVIWNIRNENGNRTVNIENNKHKNMYNFYLIDYKT